MPKFTPVSSALTALLTACVLSGCGGSHVGAPSGPAGRSSDTESSMGSIAETTTDSARSAEASPANTQATTQPTQTADAAAAAQASGVAAAAQATQAADAAAAAEASRAADAAAAAGAAALAGLPSPTPDPDCPRGQLTAVGQVNTSVEPDGYIRVHVHGTVTNATTADVNLLSPSGAPDAIALDSGGNRIGIAGGGHFDDVAGGGSPNPVTIVLRPKESRQFTIDGLTTIILVVAKWQMNTTSMPATWTNPDAAGCSPPNPAN